MPRPKGPRNKEKASEEAQVLSEVVPVQEEQDDEGPANNNYLIIGDFRIYKADPNNLVIEERKTCPVYEKVEAGKKGKGKPTNEVQEKWIRAGYISSLEFAFKFLLTRVGFQEKSIIQDYMAELADIRKLIEQHLRVKI